MADIKKDSVLVRNEKKKKDLISSEFGREIDGELHLSFIEALYLLNQDKLGLNKSKKQFFNLVSQKSKRFLSKYLVYSDLRERGLFLKGGGKNADFFLYERGKRPSNDRFSYLVFVKSERKTIKINELIKKTTKAMNTRKKSILALVDGEGDITYYEMKKFKLKGKVKFNSKEKVVADVLDDRIIAWEGGKELYNNYFVGKPFLENIYQYNFTEASFLANKGLLKLKEEKISSKAREKDPEFSLKKEIYSDLRRKGLVPKTGFKFGTHFRVYTKYSGPEDLSHAKYLVQGVKPSTTLNPPELSRAVRLAQNVRKKMLFGVVDKGISYLELTRIKI